MNFMKGEILRLKTATFKIKINYFSWVWDSLDAPNPVSYTHLDVYKRQLY